MIFLKKIIKKIVQICLKNKLGQYINELIIVQSFQRFKKINHKGVKMNFVTPNKRSLFRVNTFSTKEPETLSWIDGLSNNSILWDIGANIGLYSIYAVKKKNCTVFAFEPSVFNIELLARNINLNQLEDKIMIVPIPLSDEIGVNLMHMSNIEWGGAMSSFSKNIGWDGNPIKQKFSYNVIGTTIDSALSIFNLPQPDYIKMDVDGLEHILLKAGKVVLNKVKGIIIEINDDYTDQRNISKKLLIEYGFLFKEKLHSKRYEKSKRFGNTYNQIWEKKP